MSSSEKSWSSYERTEGETEDEEDSGKEDLLLLNAAKSGDVAAVRASLDGGAGQECKGEVRLT